MKKLLQQQAKAAQDEETTAPETIEPGADEQASELSKGRLILDDFGEGGSGRGVGLCSPAAGDEGFGGYENFFLERQVSSNKNHWSIAWSDLMMTMFILFMVMFVYKTADREFLTGTGLGSFSGRDIGRDVVAGGAGGANDFNAYGQKAYSKIYDFSRLTDLESEMADFAEINLAPDHTLRIILTGDLLFPLGGVELRGASRDLLRKIAIFLKDSPYIINVLGHTDNTPMRNGRALTNWELSTNRAAAVVRYLIDETGLPARQFSVTGFAEFRPVAANDSPENRAKNRRVEIVLSREKPKPLPLGGGDM